VVNASFIRRGRAGPAGNIQMRFQLKLPGHVAPQQQPPDEVARRPGKLPESVANSCPAAVQHQYRRRRIAG
jgi:hypothetical protein